MGFLVAHILLVVAFAMILRLSQTRGHDFFLMTGTNYATGLAIGIIWMAVVGFGNAEPVTVILGLVQGARFALAVVAIYLLLVRTGVGITFMLLRMSVVVPTIASIVWFGERPDVPTMVGMVLLLIAVPLLVGIGRSGNDRLSVWWYWPVVIGTLAVTGAGLIAAKAFVEVAPIHDMPVYVVSTFTAATAVAVITFAVRRRIQIVGNSHLDGYSPTRGLPMEPLSLGVLAGGVNIGQLVLMLLALSHVPGTIVFPTQSAGSALLTIGAGYLIWHERYRMGAIVGAGLALVGLVLVSV